MRIPETDKPAELTFAFQGAEGGASAPGVAISRPTLWAPEEKTPRVFVLFVIDTLRKDRLSAYGYKLPTTPGIDKFFARGTRWENCLSNSPWTLPSHATLFSSTLPNRHGVGERLKTLPDDLPLLAEILAKGGYRTLAVTSGGYVDPAFGFRRGFDAYSVGHGTAEARIAQALALLDRFRGEPRFLFFHTYQVHEYAAKEQSARELFGSTESLGPSATKSVSDVLSQGGSQRDLSKWLNNRYDAALRSVDDGFEALLQGLRERGLLSSTAILLTSDHGEEIFDRPSPSRDDPGLLGHIHPHLYEEYLEVPLLLRIPWARRLPDRIFRNASLVDVAPTILEALDLAPPAAFEGRSLLAPETSPPSAEEVIVSKAPRIDAIAVRQGQKKIILRPSFPLESWEMDFSFGRLPSRECFDLSNDPKERRPLSCGDSWASDLELAAERYIAASFPGSAVLRFPRRPEGSSPLEYAVRARGRSVAPQLFSFGILPGTEFSSRRASAEGRFRLDASPAWVAIRPATAGEAMELDLFGGSDVPAGTYDWRELLWRGTKILPERLTLFSTIPGAILYSRSAGDIGPEVFRRLRSLGYVSAGSPPRPASPLGAAAGPDGPFRAPEGKIAFWTAATVPSQFPLLPTRRISKLAPAKVRAGERFNIQPDGSSALAILGEGFARGDRVFWNEQPLETTFGTPEFISAAVPLRLTAQPGEVTITVRDPKKPSDRPVEATFTILER